MKKEIILEDGKIVEGEKNSEIDILNAGECLGYAEEELQELKDIIQNLFGTTNECMELKLDTTVLNRLSTNFTSALQISIGKENSNTTGIGIFKRIKNYINFGSKSKMYEESITEKRDAYFAEIKKIEDVINSARNRMKEDINNRFLLINLLDEKLNNLVNKINTGFELLQKFNEETSKIKEENECDIRNTAANVFKNRLEILKLSAMAYRNQYKTLIMQQYNDVEMIKSTEQYMNANLPAMRAAIQSQLYNFDQERTLKKLNDLTNLSTQIIEQSSKNLLNNVREIGAIDTVESLAQAIKNQTDTLLQAAEELTKLLNSPKKDTVTRALQEIEQKGKQTNAIMEALPQLGSEEQTKELGRQYVKKY